jgi:hypothetical protein
MSKEFDCVEMQRKIREDFIKEADNDFDKLIKLLEKKVEESDINIRLLARNKKAVSNCIN